MLFYSIMPEIMGLLYMVLTTYMRGSETNLSVSPLLRSLMIVFCNYIAIMVICTDVDTE
jgi:hypothetical protein